ncbi:stress response protein NST1-like [Vicia villosa]|uniref:stress response protein NST1-like n=1 Tax=Vicia villosa TaxID=3911 RepID=UPI00273C9C4B|nr:stress response protein NST1-like [Vicia villosa]
MQPYYENEIPNNTLYHHQQQQLTIDNSHSSILSTPQLSLTPNHIHHPILQHYHHSHSPHHRQQFQHFYQHKYQPQPPQQQEQQETYSLGETIVNRYIECEEGSTARVSFWKAFNNTVQYDATEKQQHENQNETCLVLDNNFDELEAVYKNKLGRNREERGSARKKMRKRKVVKEELSMMNSFLKRLVKRVVNHQEALQNKLLEVIDRMERRRIEREENWRREENELYEREAIVKARERDLAKRRESSIVSSIEKITGRKFFFVSESTHQN